jgi:ketosteroid isomerase-like protein
VSADPAADRDPRAIALAYLAAFSTSDPDAIAACVTQDFFNEHVSALGSSSRGRDEYRSRLPGFLAQFEGLRYDVEEVVVEGDHVVVAYTMRASWKGEHVVAIRGVFRFDVADGLIAHRTDYWDSLDFLRQTGQA